MHTDSNDRNSLFPRHECRIAGRVSPSVRLSSFISSHENVREKRGETAVSLYRRYPGELLCKNVPARMRLGGGGRARLNRTRGRAGIEERRDLSETGIFTHNEQTGSEAARKSETLARKSEQNGRPTTVAEIVLWIGGTGSARAQRRDASRRCYSSQSRIHFSETATAVRPLYFKAGVHNLAGSPVTF